MIVASPLIDETIHSLHVFQEIDIAAPIAISFEALIEEMGPEFVIPTGEPFPMKLEAWAGGRWYRDLGNNTGHLWGHVQVIKPPTLLEICGPMFMSYPAISHVQYRLKPDGDKTRLQLTHRAIGQILKEHREGVHMGWEVMITRIRDIAEKKKTRQ